MLKIVFFGTPEYVLPILEKLHKNFKEKSGETPITAVVTRKPKPIGRKGYLKYTAIDNWAHKKKVPIYFESSDLIKDGIKSDIGVLAAYGQIIPKSVIEHFPKGILNIHPSLLPKYRGASPVQAAIVAGGEKTGVSIIKMDERLDKGPIVSQFEEDIKTDDTTKTLRNRLFERSAEVIATLIPAYVSNKINLNEQDDNKAIYCTKITKKDGYIPSEYLRKALNGKTDNKDWDIDFIKEFKTKPSPVALERFTRAMVPWPIAWSEISINDKKKRLKIFSANVDEGKLIPIKVQLEGKNPVSWKQFQEGYKKASF